MSRALLSMPSIVVSCRSLNTPRYVAGHLDFSSCSPAGVLRGGLGLSLASAFVSSFYIFGDADEMFSKV